MNERREKMLKEKKINFGYLPYGDVCKRSTEAALLFDDSEEYEEFEAELEQAINEEISK